MLMKDTEGFVRTDLNANKLCCENAPRIAYMLLRITLE